MQQLNAEPCTACVEVSTLIVIVVVTPGRAAGGTRTVFPSADRALGLASGTQAKVVVVPTTTAGQSTLGGAESSRHVIVMTELKTTMKLE